MSERILLLLLALSAWMCMNCGSALAGSKIAVENKQLRLVFEKAQSNWILDSMTDRRDGAEMLGGVKEPSALWQIEFVRRDAQIQTQFRGGSAGEPVDFLIDAADRVVLDAASSAKKTAHEFVGSNRNRLRLIWSQIKLPDDSMVTVTADVDLSQDDGLSRWNLQIDSTSQTYALWNIRFVRLEGLARAKTSDSEYFLLPAGTGLRYSMLKEGTIEWNYPSSTMQIQMSAYLLNDAGKGLFYACFDPQANLKKFHLSNQAGVHRMWWEHYPENMGQATGNYTLPYPVVIGAFDGDWFEAAQLYKPWATQQSWCKRGVMADNDIPKWFKQNHLWKRPDGDPVEMSRNMLAFLDWFGQPFAVQWYCWNERTYDSLYPDFHPARPGFAQAVSQMEQRGVRIFPYINGLLCDPKSETWTQEGAEQWVAKTIEGKLYPYPVESNFWSYHMCPATDFWQQRIRRLAQEMNQSAQTSGLYFDCLGGMDTKLCFDKAHGHPLGGGHYWYSGFQSMMKQIRDDFRSKQRDVAFTTELMCESMIPYFDGILWCTIDAPNQIPLFQAIYGQYILSFGRGERWEDWEQDGCFENREAEAFNWGNQLGWHVGARLPAGGMSSGNFELEPRYLERSEFFKKLAAARQAAIDYIVFGQMMTPPILHNMPTVSLEGSYKVFGGQAAVKPVMYSSVWRSDSGKLAVCFVNSSREAVKTSFAFDAQTYGLDASKPLSVTALHPRDSQAAQDAFDLPGASANVSVLPRSAVIFELSQ